MATGRQARLDPGVTRGTQLGEVQTLFTLATVPSSSYVRTKALRRTHGNEVNLRIKFVQVTSGRKLTVIVVEGETDVAPNGSLPADTTVAGLPETILDTTNTRLKKNTFTIDESTTDDQGNAGFYPYNKALRSPFLWVGLKLDGAGAAGDQAQVDVAEVLTE